VHQSAVMLTFLQSATGRVFGSGRLMAHEPSMLVVVMDAPVLMVKTKRTYWPTTPLGMSPHFSAPVVVSGMLTGLANSRLAAELAAATVTVTSPAPGKHTSSPDQS